MNTAYIKPKESLTAEPKTWLVTGVTGYTGSNLLKSPLTLNQCGDGLNNYARINKPLTTLTVTQYVNDLNTESFTRAYGFKALELLYTRAPANLDFRIGDVQHSQADISKPKRQQGCEPGFDIKAGIAETMHWYNRSFTGINHA